MKKLTLILCLAIFALGCQSDDDAQEVDPNTVDADGDGINYLNELIANTDPNDPCSYKDLNLYYPATSEAWRNLDCDGDGVTNGMELDPDGNEVVEDNKTNPKFLCDLVVANQTVTPSAEFLTNNCDSDPFSNGQEIQDGTDIFDTCDFLIGNQDLDLEFYSFWFDFDCDNDGRNNGREIDDNTNPLDPNDFDGAGSILKEIYRGTKLDYSEKYTFSANGTFFDKVLDPNDNILVDFQYDNQNRLTSFIDYSNNYSVNYDYNSIDEITQVTIDDNGDIYSYTVVYDGNIIYTYDGSQPSGLFTQKFTFNNQNKLILRENLLSSDVVIKEVYEYDANFDNLLSSFQEKLGYNPDTGEAFNVSFLFSEVNNNYSYGSENDFVNLFFNPYQNIKMNVILMNRPEKLLRKTFFNNLGALSTDFLSVYSFSTSSFSGGVNGSFGYGANFIQQNGLPSKISWGTLGGSASYEVHYE